MPILKWIKIDLYCDVCMKNLLFEGDELRFIDWIKEKGWKIRKNKCYCEEHNIQQS